MTAQKCKHFKNLLIGISAIAINDQLGLPRTSSILEKNGFIAEVDYFRKVPLWVLEHYTKDSLRKTENVTRKDVSFINESELPSIFQSTNLDYKNSGYSRGHMAPAAAHKVSQEHMNDTFSLGNIVPQDLDNNKYYWASLENWTRELVKNGFDDVWILSGPCWMPDSFSNSQVKALTDGGSINAAKFDINGPVKDSISYETIGKQRIAVPTHLFKVVVAKLPPQTKISKNDPKFPKFMIASFLIPNKPVPDFIPLNTFEVPLPFLEKFTGIHIFPNLQRFDLGLLCTTQIKINGAYQSICTLRPNQYRITSNK